MEQNLFLISPRCGTDLFLISLLWHKFISEQPVVAQILLLMTLVTVSFFLRNYKESI